MRGMRQAAYLRRARVFPRIDANDIAHASDVVVQKENAVAPPASAAVHPASGVVHPVIAGVRQAGRPCNLASGILMRSGKRRRR